MKGKKKGPIFLLLVQDGIRAQRVRGHSYDKTEIKRNKRFRSRPDAT